MATKKPFRSLPGSPTPGDRIRRAGRYEIYHQPSPAARRLWYYVRAIGKANAPSTFHHVIRGRDGYLLHLVRKGRLWYRIRERRHVAKRGEACLMDLREAMSYGVDGPRTAELYWVLFGGKDMTTVFAELRADREPIFTKLDSVRVQVLFREMISLTERQPAAYEVKMGSVLLALLAELFACRGHPISYAALVGRDRPLSFAVRKGIDHITAWYDHARFISIKTVATQVGQSVNYFIRRFHEEVGMSPKAFLNRYRIEQAKSQIETSDRTIEEVARSVGFTDQNYFARQFTKITGTSPREYRRTHLTDHRRKTS
jgi:AraC-like DNA-binding protein